MNRFVRQMLMRGTKPRSEEWADEHSRSSIGTDYAGHDYRRGSDAHRKPEHDRVHRGYEHGYQHHNDYDSPVEHRKRERTEYGKLSKEYMEDWKENMENEDGSKGFHYTKEQVEQVAKQTGLDPNKYGLDILCITTNMMYSDYYPTAKKFGVDRTDFYIHLAHDFLEDKDFHGNGEEKLWLYYKCIAEKEDY